MEHQLKMVWYQQYYPLHFIHHHNFLIANNSISDLLAAVFSKDAVLAKHEENQTELPEGGLCIAVKNFGMLRELLWKQKGKHTC